MLPADPRNSVVQLACLLREPGMPRAPPLSTRSPTRERAGGAEVPSGRGPLQLLPEP